MPPAVQKSKGQLLLSRFAGRTAGYEITSCHTIWHGYTFLYISVLHSYQAGAWPPPTRSGNHPVPRAVLVPAPSASGSARLLVRLALLARIRRLFLCSRRGPGNEGRQTHAHEDTTAPEPTTPWGLQGSRLGLRGTLGSNSGSWEGVVGVTPSSHHKN